MDMPGYSVWIKKKKNDACRENERKKDDYRNETAFLAVVRAFLTEEKAALEELAALTEKQWNHLFVVATQHSLLSAVYDVVGKTPEFAGLEGSCADR